MEFSARQLIGSVLCLLMVTASSALADETNSYMELNPAAGSMVLYELQARSANACDPTVGSDAQRAQCLAKPAPKVVYRAQNMSCDPTTLANLSRIRLGTLDDLMTDTTDYRTAISLRYIHDRLGANAVWLMPIFPDNDTWNIPDPCDNLGSPYAVRDYMHVRGSLSRACIAQGRDSHDDADPCWGNDTLDKLIAEAHARGMKILLDVAFNHFGHNYEMYDYARYTPIRDRIAQGEDLNRLWDFNATFEPALLHPVILDSEAALRTLAASDPAVAKRLASLEAKCPNLHGQDLVRLYHMWTNALDWERAKFTCDGKYLEYEDPGFYLGGNAWDPSTHVGDNFTNNWRDVKFLFHHEDNLAHTWEFVREREYLFRILNYWVSRGVDGFRFDHTTDPQGGMGPNEWKYLLSKVDYYAYRRGQSRPVYLAEEFGDQTGMSHVVDIMTDGYVGNMTGRGGATKDTDFVEHVLGNNNRFHGHTYVMTGLETHDEQRLLTGTGFDIWTGAGFWGIGATTWSTPMLLMGQEFGESWGLGFRRSDFLRSRFVGSPNYNPAGDSLIDYYGSMIKARLDPRNRALIAPNQWFLRPKNSPDAPDPRIFAQVKWSDDGNVVFTFHNLWEQDVSQDYFIPPALADQLRINDSMNYRLIDALSNQQMGNCVSGADLKSNFPVFMNAGTRAQWLRLELCN